tara:strand:- start:965 stop:1132 length:168 start_codon:yes stop_codon:yes gene_type:complete
MNKDRLKLIIKNLELLVNALKSEVYSDVESYTTSSKDQKSQFFYQGRDDDDGYPD